MDPPESDPPEGTSPKVKVKERKKQRGLEGSPKKSRSNTKTPHSPVDNGLPNSNHVNNVNTVEDAASAEELIRNEKRTKLIKEMLATEDLHVEALKTVVVEYLEPLRSVLPKEKLRKLFGNTEVIMGWNMQFSGRLKARQEESEAGEDREKYGIIFGDILAEMTVILRQLYSQYSEGYEEAQRTYKECMQLKEFEQFMQTKSLQNHKANLLAALYLPIQRMIAYATLLKEIIGLTPQDHPDYEDLCNSLKMIIGATKQADRVVEKKRNMDLVLKVQAQLNGGDIAEPHRRYVYEGDVNLVVGKQQKERRLFLFSDVVILGKLKKKKYDVEFKLKLLKSKFEDIEEDRGMFKIIDEEDNNTEYVLDSDEKQTWLQMLLSTKRRMGETPLEVKSLQDEEVEERENDRMAKLKNLPTYEELIEKVLLWSTMSKTDDVMSEIRDFAAKIKKAT